MSEYFSDKDNEQSFEMPSDQSSPMANLNQSGQDDPTLDPKNGESSQTPQGSDLVYVGVMSIIILVMIYTLYSMFFSGTQQEKIEIPQAPVVESAPVKPQPVPEPMAPVPVESSTPPVTKQKSSDADKNLSESVAELSSENNYLTMMVRKLNSDNEKLSSSIQNLESEIDDLINSRETIKAQIAELQDKTQKTVQKVDQQAPKELTEYSLEAVVEGRAWLIGSKGSNKTVKVGDTIKDYGTVTRIDPLNSIVYTSSGRQIRVN